jgi:predicted secreted acid phosphatase
LGKRFTILAVQFVFLFGVGWLAAQQPAQPAFSTDAAAERIPNLDTIKKELREYHDCTCACGCYAHDLDAQADRAIAFLRQRAAWRTPNEKSGAKEKLALILDIDETTLSNYKELAGADFAYNTSVFDAWVDTGQAPAIPGTLRLYKEAQRLGVSVFFITGRTELQRAATERNLRAVGFDNWLELAMRPAAHGMETIGAFKALVREQIVAQGYTLILNVGDQWSDLKGKPEAEFSVKYPDPFYFIP